MSSTPLTWPTMLPNCAAWCRACARHQRGLVARLTRLASVGLGGADRPFLRSLWRWPRICRSSVSTSAQHFAALARSIRRPMKLAVAHHVELEPERLLGVRGDVLDRADAHRRERERDAELLGRARGEDLAVGVLHAGQADRRQRHRHRDVLADHRRARACAFSMLTATRWRSLMLREVALVGAVGALGPRAGVGVVVEHARHALLREQAQVFDVGDDRHRVLPGGAQPTL